MRAAQADTQHQVRREALVPGLALGRALAVDPAGQAVDQPGFLKQRDEQPRRHIADTGVLPAQQRLETAQVAVGKTHLGLIHQAEILLFDGGTYAVFEHQP
ncbi:hypothetical protein D3C81_1499340 [compost metagenome]